MTTLGSSFISGITTTIFDSTDIVNKDYVDNYVAVPSQTGNAGKFLTTTDGTSTSWDYVSNYEEFTTTGINTFNVPSYSNLLYIEAVGAGGGGNAGQTTAQAAVTWTLRTSGYGNSAVHAFTYANNIYGAAGIGGRFFVSTDTIIWTARTVGGGFGGGNAIDDAIYADNLYLVSSNASGGTLSTSIDTINWTARTCPVNQKFSLTYGNGIYVAGGASGSSGEIATSTNAITWTLRTSGQPGASFLSLIYANNLYVAGIGNILTSTDSIIWTKRTAGTNQIASLTYGNNLYVAAGSGLIASSTDAITWILRTSGTINTLNDITFGNNTYIAVGNSGTLITSTNAIIWNLRTTKTAFNLLAVTHTNNIFILGGGSSSSNSTLEISYSQASGAGGGAGSYTSWYIPKAIVSSNLTVNPGVGGTGATTDAATGSVGAGTTISWTGPGGTYTLTASGGSGTAAGAAQTSITSSFYTTAGGSGASFTPIGSGNTATQT